MSKRNCDKRTLRTKQAICTALVYLLKEKEFSSITIKELADKAGINRKTFYLHYKDVESVLNDIEDQIIEEIRPLVSKIKIDLIFLDSYEFVHGVANILLTNELNYNYMIQSDNYNHLFKKIRNVLIFEISKRYITEVNSTSSMLNYALTYAVSGCVELFYQWVFDKRTNKPTIEELCFILATIMKDGFATTINKATIKDNIR